MVRAYSVNLLNRVAEGHRLVCNELDEVVRSTLPRKQLELFVDCP